LKSSLSLRLLIASAISTALALVATGLILNLLFRAYFEERIASELESYLLVLTGGVGLTADHEIQVAPLADPRFSQPLSGYYWQVEIEGQEARLSPSFWAAPLRLERPETAGTITFQRTETGTGESVSVASWIVTVGENEIRRDVFLTVAFDRTELDISEARFATNTAIWLVVLGAFLILGGWAQVRVGLKPLGLIRAEVNAVKSRHGARLSADYPIEVQPLVHEVNDLLDESASSIRRVRAGANNLAHGLKTPLTIMRAIAQEARKSGITTVAEEMETEIDNMQHFVERELARVRTGGAANSRTEIAPVAKRLCNALRRQPLAEGISWHLDVPAQIFAPIDEFDLTELLGNLIDNAIKHTNGTIRLSAGQNAGRCFLQVEDDGPGIAKGQIKHASERGTQFSADNEGQGIGLAIVREIAERHGSSLTIENCEPCGLIVRIDWPL